jgi:hypothetical protein
MKRKRMPREMKPMKVPIEAYRIIVQESERMSRLYGMTMTYSDTISILVRAGEGKELPWTKLE